MKLLIVEDDIAFAQTLERRLAKHGFECHATHQADTVLHLCHQLKPSHILLDMKLASVNSLTLIPTIRAALPYVKMVLLTGYASIATAVEAMRLGADDYLAKPADTATIVKALAAEVTSETALNEQQQTMSPDRLEWEHIQQVLSANNGNVSATARQLGMHRRTLQRKLQKKPISK